MNERYNERELLQSSLLLFDNKKLLPISSIPNPIISPWHASAKSHMLPFLMIKSFYLFLISKPNNQSGVSFCEILHAF